MENQPHSDLTEQDREALRDDLGENLNEELDIDVRIIDAPRKNYRTGYPDILNHPQHYKKWHSPSQAQLQIVCHQTVLDQIQHHAKSFSNQEIGGILVGHYYVYDNSNYLEIREYLPAPREGYGQNSGSHFTFTETIWAEMLREKDRNPTLEDMDVVGWFHSHPNWGTQPSSLDIDIQQEHFSYEWQVALIYDPYRHEGDFYLWNNQQLVTAPGFYEVFSRIRPNVVTNWRNYLAPKRPPPVDKVSVEAAQSVAENGGDEQPVEPTQEGGDDEQAQQEQSDATLQGAESDSAAVRAAARTVARAHNVPAANAPIRADQEQISISNDDIYRSFLRRHWVELVTSGMIIVLIPLIAYLAYGVLTAPPEQDANNGQPQPGQVVVSGSGMYDPSLLESTGSAAKEPGQALQMEISAPPFNGAPQLSVIGTIDSALICTSHSDVERALMGGNTFVLIMKPQTENLTSILYAAPTLSPELQGTVCFEQPSNKLYAGTWQGAIYVTDADQAAAGIDQLEPLHFSPFGPSFTVLIDEDARGNNDR